MPTIRPNPILRTYVIAAAVLAALVSPLLAIAYFATEHGEEFLQGTVAIWAEPAREIVEPLVTFAGPDRVYATYSQIMFLLFPALVLTALAVRGQRPHRRLERAAWNTTISGYAIFLAGGTTMALALLPTRPDDTVVDVAFMALMVPGMLLSVLGSTALGISLLRGAFRPRATAWLLAFTVPFLALGSGILGHNSLGLVPWFAAWAIAAWRWPADTPEAINDADQLEARPRTATRPA